MRIPLTLKLRPLVSEVRDFRAGRAAIEGGLRTLAPEVRESRRNRHPARTRVRSALPTVRAGSEPNRRAPPNLGSLGSLTSVSRAGADAT